MKYHWLNRQNNSELIVFFAGWSFDEKPFEFLDCGSADVLFVYDYNEISPLPELGNYNSKTLITWSMGVFAAYLIHENFKDFDKKIAVNGTPFPVDDDFGIPQKPFLLTLRHAKTGLEGKFYQNIFEKENEFERYSKTTVSRSIENRADELKSLYEKIKTTKASFSGNAIPEQTPLPFAKISSTQVRNDKKNIGNFYDFALISANDKIIPTKNQINFWQNNAPYKILERGHFPFYNFKSWIEIIQLANQPCN